MAPLSHALLPELQRYNDTVRCGALGAKFPGHRQQQLTQTLIVRLLKTHLFLLFQILGCPRGIPSITTLMLEMGICVTRRDIGGLKGRGSQQKAWIDLLFVIRWRF